jgi:hypothetical protein
VVRGALGTGAPYLLSLGQVLAAPQVLSKSEIQKKGQNQYARFEL